MYISHEEPSWQLLLHSCPEICRLVLESHQDLCSCRNAEEGKSDIVYSSRFLSFEVKQREKKFYWNISIRRIFPRFTAEWQGLDECVSFNDSLGLRRD